VTVKVVDLNLLLSAVNRDSAEHLRAKSWLDDILSGHEPVGLPWVVILGFLRLTTNGRIFPRPIPSHEAMEIVQGWLDRSQVVPLSPGENHWRILRDLLDEAGTAGNLTTDAHIAALTMESGAELMSADAEFGRFRGLRWRNPLAGSGSAQGG